MKFVCDNCQAKYQIGDDKVAGKTVRMKCRKCGYNIKVSPSGAAEASPPEAPLRDTPSPDAPSRDAIPAPPVSMLQAITPPVSAPHAGAAQAKATRPGWGALDDESTSIMNAPVRDAVAAVVAASRPAPQAPPPPRAPASGVTGVSPPRALTGSAAPRPPPAAQPRPVTRQTTGPSAPSATRPGLSSSSLAAAAHEPAHTAPVAAEPQWYVGIGGSPIGPVSVAVIRERAAAGEVDGESLVWREGLAEWRALRTIPELLEVVTAAARAVARAPTPTPFAAMAALSAPVGGPSVAAHAPSPAVATPAPVAAAPAPVAAAPAAATPAPAPFAPAPVPAAAAPAQQHGDPFAPAPSPFVGSSAPIAPLVAPAPNGAPKANGLHVANGVEAAVPVDAPHAPSPAVAPKPVAAPVDIDPALEAALVPRRGNTHPMAYAFIAAAAVFGGVAAYVLLSKPPPAPIVVVQGPTVTPTASAAPTAVADDRVTVDVGDPLAVGSAARPALGKPWPKGSASATPHDTTPLDTSSFVTNVPGPQATAPSGPSAGGTLSQGEMNAVVAQNQARVRRKCWQPALDAQAANAPKNARVVVAISIAASGSVDSASASGADSFPGLASCIGGMVKGWKFPPSGGPTTVSVPFTFVGQ